MAGYYEITADSLLINGRAETTNVSTNIVVNSTNTDAYVLSQRGITPTPIYTFTLYLNSSNNTFYVQVRDIATNSITNMPYYAATPQTFAVAFLVNTPISPTYFITGPSVASGTQIPVSNIVPMGSQTVYIIYDHPYTKMVQWPSNIAKFYSGIISIFSTANWDTYSIQGPGQYIITPIPYKILGPYIFGPNMSMDGVYFDNAIYPKPDLTDLSFVNLTLSNGGTSTSSQLVLQGWNFTNTILHRGNFSNIAFQDCICNATDFSGSNISDSAFLRTVTVVNPPPPPTSATNLNLLARYDASVASGYTLSGSNVTQWNDLTGNGYHLTANGTGPTLTTINSVTALNFNPGYGLIRASVPLKSEITVFMVAKYSTAIAMWGNFIHHGHRDTDWSLERNSTGSTVQFQSNNDTTYCQIAAANNTNYLWVGRITGNTRQFWMYSDTLEPVYVTSSTPVVNMSGGNKTIYVGKSDRSDTSEPCNSSIGEILYYNASISNVDVSANVLYLRNKWFNNIVAVVSGGSTLQNAKFTNATINNLTIAGFNNDAAVSANQMNVDGLDFSGCVINGLKTYFLNRTGGGPLRMTNAYGGPVYTMLTDSLIGRFIAGPTMNLSGLTLGNVAFNQTNFAGSNIYGTKLATTTMTGVRVSNGRLTYSSLTTTLPSNFKIVNPLLSAQTVQYDVTNSGSSAYVINSQNNLTLVLTRGSRYVFNISASGHPFWIKTARTTGTGNAYSTGVTNNGISSGIGVTTFIVPLDAPNTLYYQCELHASMGGILTISDVINTYPTYIIGPGADLSGVDATGVVFTGANISGANFTNATFTNVVSGQLTPAPTNALNFDGDNDYVTLGVPAVCNTEQFRTTMTVECWFRTTDTNNQKFMSVLVSINQTMSSSYYSQFILYLTPAGSINFGLTNTNNSLACPSSAPIYKDAKWHHAAGTYNSSNGTSILYIDGIAVSTIITTGFGLLSNNITRLLVIGSDDLGVVNNANNRQFRGSIADVRIWNVVRTPAEIFNNYTNLLLGNEPGLIIYNKFVNPVSQ